MRGFNFQQGNQPGQQQGAQAAQAAAVTPGDRGVLSHDLMVELMGAVPTFGNTKVVVGFYGDQAFCNQKLKYVNLPKLPPGLMIPSRIAMEIRGFAAHEAAHLIWTDPDTFPGALTDEEMKDPLLKEVWNAIEDYMIERNWLMLYPGAHKNFTATEARCCAQYLAQYPNHPDMAKDLRVAGAVGLTWCRSIYFGLKTPLSADCLKTMPPSLQQRVSDWFYDIVDVETTLDCLEAARRIVQDIRANPFDPADPPADPNHNPMGGNQGGPGQPGSGSGQGQGQGGSGGGAFSGGLTPGAGAGAGGNQPDPYKVGHNLGSTYDDLGLEEKPNGHMSFGVHSNSTEGPASEVLSNAQGIQVAQRVEAEVASTIGTVSRILRRALQSLSRERWKGGRPDGQIDDKRLAGVITGALEIYKKKKPMPEIETAVSILVDCSGSMGGTEIMLCQQLAVILQKSFAGTPIKFEILGYTSGDYDSLPDGAKVMVEAIRQQDPNHSPDIRSVMLYEFKGFETPHHVALTTIGNMPQVEMGGTPTADGILMAHERLSKRKERRHVMFVLTDGQPDDMPACQEAVRAVEACNATVLGIGIQCDAVRHCFNDWIVLQDARDMSAAVLGKLSEMLFKDRLKVGTKMKQKPGHIRHA